MDLVVVLWRRVLGVEVQGGHAEERNFHCPPDGTLALAAGERSRGEGCEDCGELHGASRLPEPASSEMA